LVTYYRLYREQSTIVIIELPHAYCACTLQRVAPFLITRSRCYVNSETRSSARVLNGLKYKLTNKL